MKSKLETYGLSVCFAMVVSLVISMSIAGYALLEIVTPEVTMSSYEYEKYQTNESYWKSNGSCSKEESSAVKPGDEELTKQRSAAFAKEIENEKRVGFQSLMQCLLFIATSAVSLCIHWIIARKARIA